MIAGDRPRRPRDTAGTTGDDAAAKVSEGHCPDCNGRLERIGPMGWCEVCRLGWSARRVWVVDLQGWLYELANYDATGRQTGGVGWGRGLAQPGPRPTPDRVAHRRGVTPGRWASARNATPPLHTA